MTVYFIGGSPCSGKSTVAQALSERYDLAYFKVDDHLDQYMRLGAEAGKRCCTAIAGMSPEEIWMRDPVVQCAEELQIYEEISEYVLKDLAAMDDGRDVITEGAAYLPVIARCCGIPQERYISVTPTRAFQISHYRERPWVPHVLAGCSDREKAFANWMERDALFAQAVQGQCREAGYVSLINGGESSVEELTGRVAAHFGLAGNCTGNFGEDC